MEDELGLVGFVLIVLLIGGWVIEGVNQAAVERACLSVGYPNGDFRWIGPNYCIKRIDQTDVVVTLDEARRGSR